MALDAKERNNIILGAVNMTGPDTPVFDEDGNRIPSDWNSRLKLNAKKLTAMLSETSDISKTVDMLAECKVFVGTILYVTKEKSSKRGFVGLKTQESKFSPDGVETVRTEITEGNPDVNEFCRNLRNLTGHRVLVYVFMDKSEDGTRKFRVLQHVEDLGAVDGFDPEEGKALTLGKLTKR
ncbi:hypothetical protein [Arthrobacter sp. A2-55]|uniref:hypothetical protein n=1 Tax=Arthrobacter sp. A2-55 TaxID=2897337 RepID=UPI0021CD1EE8|nr:hypothetical protein [Arthrobacter sp. A2-55]MCU6479110.1 hypothetical protein [Arthrobacter sp. A2-55]